MSNLKTKICTGPLCKGKVHPITNFYKNPQTKDGYHPYCKDCIRNYRQQPGIKELYNNTNKKWYYKNTSRQPMKDSKNSPIYLGIYVAENVLSKVFKNVEKMPNNNPGFDFICNKGYKIDVKSSVLLKGGKRDKNLGWSFAINKNKIADYFLLIGFDNREDLNPLKLWLIPGNILNEQKGKHITNIEKVLLKWKQYELNNELEKVIICCNKFKDN